MKRTILLIIALLASPLSMADVLGRVVGVSDGDTLTLLTVDKTRVKVRLAEIDTPEKAQPYGQKSKQALSSMVFGKDIVAKVKTKDRYGRTVAHIFVGNAWVNAELVKSGAAWVYRQYSKDKRLLSMEREAKQARRGLWSLPEPERMPPWEWRKAKRNGEKATKANRKAGSFSCGSKRYCKQMTSCNEARFYLNQCGLGRLDRDKDGVPCENLCK